MHPTEQTNRLHGPNLMPNRRWSREPTSTEREMADLWEDKYFVARCFFEGDKARTDLLFDTAAGFDIAPDRYIHWLRDSYHQFMRCNVAENPRMARAYTEECRRANAAGYMVPGQQPEALGAVALSVGRYGDRVFGPGRGFDSRGVRLDLHHSPHDTMSHLHRGDGTAIAIAEDVHKFLHRVRDRHRVRENTYDNVTNDFELLLRELAPRGYTERQIKQAREQVHERNEALGVYKGTKRDAPYR